MSCRTVGLLILYIGVALCSPAHAAITAFWVPVASGDGSVGTLYPTAATGGEFGDPVLLGMQTWDLRVITTGDWSEAGMRAELPSGSFYRGSNAGVTKPVTALPGQARDFWTYVSIPSDASPDPSNIIVPGGFPQGEPVSNGTSNGDNIPGVFSCRWMDLHVDLPSPVIGYQIGRLTFPLGVIPDVLTVDQNPSFSYTSQWLPNGTTAIPEIPEISTNCLLTGSLLFWLLRRGQLR